MFDAHIVHVLRCLFEISSDKPNIYSRVELAVATALANPTQSVCMTQKQYLSFFEKYKEQQP